MVNNVFVVYHIQLFRPLLNWKSKLLAHRASLNNVDDDYLWKLVFRWRQNRLSRNRSQYWWLELRPELDWLKGWAAKMPPFCSVIEYENIFVKGLTWSVGSIVELGSAESFKSILLNVALSVKLFGIDKVTSSFNPLLLLSPIVFTTFSRQFPCQIIEIPLPYRMLSPTNGGPGFTPKYCLCIPRHKEPAANALQRTHTFNSDPFHLLQLYIS